ncbi:SRPBCC family protein [Gordonia sp. (in: high G+C Gram-positive bacteria)]|jgi:ribosome-associated toxin RatA of RatAB toxin-antitoxin module|uniref:SRPBCC family protein n=1 Tax=Gordonia sp. (in: high G+C Gram-positive bacteria) TaxID=84139 RepID=UPI001DFBBF9E|nr:SRPBCC family protein [Gordonia sp. (in: high G+C Gram-positive bacteria)]MCB1293939.1 SRPBCC family protein [Gordonia sp. (in: high G+C Gram-positive bacteria)]HMS75676.1 SRPBCC family protein [Gordonia sp. (in: high G+C Gram-positive bacteria)]HQV19961.1 SRPBCC family protein [Gordonia sp. (in: high G+C Gram-positive bacteria)]
MADRTQQSIVIGADPEQILAVIADFPRYPEWVSAARSVEVLDTLADGRAAQVRFDLDVGILQDTYVLAYEWAAGGDEVSWRLVSSNLQRDQRGRYVLSQQVPGSTKVTYELMVDLLVPMIGQLKRRAEKAITDTALNELKKRVEG